MANSDWARETPQKEEIKWFYFQPVLRQREELDWQFTGNGAKWYDITFPIRTTFADLDLFWRKPYTSKGN